MRKKAEPDAVPFDIRSEELIRVLQYGVRHCHTISDSTKESIMLFVTQRQDEIDEEEGRDSEARKTDIASPSIEEEISAAESPQPFPPIDFPSQDRNTGKDEGTEVEAMKAVTLNQEPPLFKQRGGNI